MSPLPYSLEDAETNNLFIELDRRLANLEGKVGEGLSHNDLIDIEDHKTFLKQDGSVPVIGNLDFSKSGQIKNTKNKILNVDIFNGSVKVNENNNQLEVDVSVVNVGTDHGLLVGLTGDDHAGHPWLLGRSGGQALIGGINSGDDLLFQSTSNATKGFIGFTSLSNGMIWDETNNRLSIGSASNDMTIGGVSKGHIFTTHSQGGMNAYDIAFHRHSSTSGSFLMGARTRGSEASPIIVQDGDNLLDIFGVGYDGSDFQFAASIMFDVDGTPGIGDMPGMIRFATTPDGGTSVVERMRISQDGNVGIGTLNPQEKLSVEGIINVPKASTNGIKVDTTTPTFGFADLLGEVIAKNTGASKPNFTTYRDNLLDFQFAAGKEEYFKYHIPHDYVKGTDIFVHVHWSHTGSLVTGGTLTFNVESSYSKSHNQAPFPASVNGDYNGAVSTVQYQQILSEVQLSASSPTGLQIDTDDLEPDGVIMMTLQMKTNSITVSGGGVPDPFIHYVDIHYQTTGLIGTKDKAPDFYV